MRTIKFRAWNKTRKEMYNVHGWHSEFVFEDTIDGIGTEGNPERVEDVEIMQFTGLHDKNGREIYEGDVVKYCNPYSKKWHEHTVKWDSLWATFGLFEQGNEWCKESDWVKIQHIEILGNIHENPELLNQ